MSEKYHWLTKFAHIIMHAIFKHQSSTCLLSVSVHTDSLIRLAGNGTSGFVDVYNGEWRSK